MQAAGLIICALVGFRLIQSIAGAFRTRSAAREVAARSLELLDERIAATRAIRQHREQSDLHWNGYRKFRVGKKVQEADGITSLYLFPHDKKPLPVFRPGQYLTFRFQMPGDRASESSQVIRCYSLSDAPCEQYFRITVKRVPAMHGTDHPPGRISSYVQDQVNVGDILDVQAPRGDFALDPHGTNPVVLIGGGVGVTPVLCMLNAIVQSRSIREVWFFYAVRNSGDHIMRDHLRRLADAHPNIHLLVCYSEPTDSDKAGLAHYQTGYLNVDVIKEQIKVCNFDFYVCGPPPMMESLVPALEKWGVAKERIHTEAFGPASAKPKTPAKKTAVAGTKTSTVQFSRSGKKAVWDGTMPSLLDLAIENGVRIDSGCRAGSCGTCLVAVREGVTESEIEPDAECGDGSCLTCISTPVGDVVLDA